MLNRPDLNGDLVYSEEAGYYGAYFVVTDYSGGACLMSSLPFALSLSTFYDCLPYLQSCAYVMLKLGHRRVRPLR